MTAAHDEATGKLGAAHFLTDGCVPLLDEKNELIELLAELLDYGEDAKERGETAVLFGNSSSSGSPEHNRELSLWRGKMVKALLDHDEIAWRNTARTHAKPEDARQILSSLHKAHGWECDPESESTKSHGVFEFQQEANSRFDLDLTEDGILGPKTWTAIHRALCALIQDELGYDPDQEPDWPLLPWGFAEGAGVYPNGSDHATGGNKESERNVEVCFFPKGCEPKLKLPKDGKKGTVKENPREVGKRFEKGDLANGQASFQILMESGPGWSELLALRSHRNGKMIKIHPSKFKKQSNTMWIAEIKNIIPGRYALESQSRRGTLMQKISDDISIT